MLNTYQYDNPLFHPLIGTAHMHAASHSFNVYIESQGENKGNKAKEKKTNAATTSKLYYIKIVFYSL